MNKRMQITYYHHSGFSVASGDVLLVFDYWTGKQQKLHEALQISPAQLRRFSEVYVFISHDHIDHFDEVVYTWQQYAPVTYIIADDMPPQVTGRRMGPGGEMILSDRLTVKAFGSTDAGVSFMATLDGVTFFHAGDLNFWHWREVSTIKQIEEADEDFRKEMAAIPSGVIDVAFFPVDPRMGMHFDAGANFFMMATKPRLLVPMHFWGRREVIVEYARRSRTRDTEIVAMTVQGQSFTLEMDDEDCMNISMLPLPVLPQEPSVMPNDVNLDGYEGNDPFQETDMPVDME